MIRQIDEQEAQAYFERLDPLVREGTVLFVIGGSAVAQLGAKIRVTAAIDVALPYSKLELSEFAAADLIASKLYRYSEQDQEDILFLLRQGGVTLDAVREAVTRLPERFRDDVLVQENLANLAVDFRLAAEVGS